MRVAAAFSRLLRLDGVWVRDVEFEPELVVVEVALRRRRLVCPQCGFSTPHRHDQRPVDSRWRHLDLGVWRLEVRARLRRLRCPAHGVLVEGVPFARHRADSRATSSNSWRGWPPGPTRPRSRRLVRIDWDTVGRIVQRVSADELDPDRLDGLFEIGIDEVSWRRQHRYLTLVTDHQRGCVVWGTDGNGQGGRRPVLRRARAGTIRARSRRSAWTWDPATPRAPAQHAPQAILCIDNFHVAALATKALDEVRRDYWNQLRALGDQQAAKRFKDARWALLKNPENLTDRQAATHRELRHAGGAVWRAYTAQRSAPRHLRRPA